MRWLMIVVVLAACEKADAPAPPPPPDPLHGVELPDVAGPGYIAATRDPTILVTPSAIVVRGQAPTVDGLTVVGLTNGEVAADEKEGGALGIKIIRLATMGEKLVASHVAAPLVLALDRRAPYQIFIESLFSLKQSGWSEFGLLAKAKGATVMAPITIPDRSPGPLDAQTVRLAVMSSTDNLLVWSFSGMEGTLQVPKATIPWSDPDALTKLSSTLGEIVWRRWPGQRPDDSRPSS